MSNNKKQNPNWALETEAPTSSQYPHSLAVWSKHNVASRGWVGGWVLLLYLRVGQVKWYKQYVIS